MNISTHELHHLNPFVLAPAYKRMAHNCSFFYLLPFLTSWSKEALHLNDCKLPWGHRITLWWRPSDLF